jgi:hypothetical protein
MAIHTYTLISQMSIALGASMFQTARELGMRLGFHLNPRVDDLTPVSALRFAKRSLMGCCGFIKTPTITPIKKDKQEPLTGGKPRTEAYDNNIKRCT